MACNKTLEITSAIRGYHYYRTFWKPDPNQILNCYYENDNAFDRFAIKVCEFGKEIPVGHLPKEISRVTKYLLDRGATATATLTSIIDDLLSYKEGSKFHVKLVLPCQELSAVF